MSLLTKSIDLALGFLGSGPEEQKTFVCLSLCTLVLSKPSQALLDLISAFSDQKSGLSGLKLVLLGLKSALLGL